MTKASFKTKGGTQVILEGEPEKVAALIKILEGESKEKFKKITSSHKEKTTPMNLVNSLIDGGFFTKPKDLASIKIALQEMGHHYPVTSLSPTLLRLVRRRQLRRIKDKKRWLYTG